MNMLILKKFLRNDYSNEYIKDKIKYALNIKPKKT